MNRKKFEAFKKWRKNTRLVTIKEEANKLYNHEMASTAETVWGVSGFVEGAQWADLHPWGFINDDYYVDGLLEHKEMTNKEFIEILQQFPEDAFISIECCNPRAIMFDEKDNLRELYTCCPRKSHN